MRHHLPLKLAAEYALVVERRNEPEPYAVDGSEDITSYGGWDRVPRSASRRAGCRLRQKGRA